MAREHNGPNDKLDDFIRALLERAKASGIERAEAYSSRGESFKSLVENGEIYEYEVHSSGGLALRGLVGGKMGIAYTEAFDEEAIGMLIERVLESAALIEDPDEQFLFEGSPSYERVDTLASTPGGGSEAEKIEYSCDLERRALSMHPLVKKLGHTTGVESERSEVRIVGTNGLNLYHAADTLVAIISVVAKRDDIARDATCFRIGRELADIPTDEMVREAIDTAVFQLDARPCESGTYDIIFNCDAMSALLGTFSGVFSAENTQKDLSMLKGKVGEEIASAVVTLADDPLLPRGVSTRPFDDEGVAARRKNVIENGRLTTLLHNLKTAKKDGVESTGNAAKAGYASPVRVAPSNFYFVPGDDTLDALMERMGDGLTLTELAGLHSGADAVSGDFSLPAKGYRVRGGKKAEAVDQITVAGNFYTLLKQIKAFANDLVFPTGSTGSPSVWAGRLSIAGK
ncbi:MAG: TldD/PmbA family protein [Oscillospiraceae bacterium]|jgi:PmbA protein|nr:TldD/PmbA family protein [Oscillospiraceae bacterium]